MNTTQAGREAEELVASKLKKQGYKLLDQNWRTKQCEIDLVMERKKTVYFIEVKYRSSNAYGAGLEYITPKKVQQMKFAAEIWMSKNGWDGDARLCGVEVGVPIGVVELVQID
jgi:uncharacterized protein (TIGR00252 family)